MSAYADYFAMKNEQGYQAWGSWTSAYPEGLPILQYTTSSLDENSASYPLPSPMSELSSQTDVSPMSSPTHFCFTSNLSTGLTTPTVLHPSMMGPKRTASLDSEQSEEDDEEEYCPPQLSSSGPLKSKIRKSSSDPRHSKIASSGSWTMAKRAHNIVERNYRDRLNTKISELSSYLFEGSTDSRAKPSKSVVIARAKERLTQLEVQNRELLAEVSKLKQQVAIHNHVANHA